MSEDKQKPDAAGGPGKPLSDQAIDWLVRLSSGRASPADRLDFQRWRSRSPEHEAAAMEAEALLHAVGQTRQAAELRRQVEPLSIARQPRRADERRPVGRRLLFAGAAAASVAAVALALPALEPLATLYADHGTAVGQRKRVELVDGSVVILNTATALSVDYSDRQRRVVLYDGEALFVVAKDPNRPFVVIAGNAAVRAVGTAFAVRRKEAGEQVTVSEGTVEARIYGQEPVAVEAGQRLEIGEDGRLTLDAVDVASAIAWQRGKLIFNRRPLESVVAELQRYRAGRIVIAGERLKALQVTGVFDLDDSDHLLRTIEETTKARVVRLPLLAVIR